MGKNVVLLLPRAPRSCGRLSTERAVLRAHPCDTGGHVASSECSVKIQTEEAVSSFSCVAEGVASHPTRSSRQSWASSTAESAVLNVSCAAEGVASHHPRSSRYFWKSSTKRAVLRFSPVAEGVAYRSS